MAITKSWTSFTWSTGSSTTSGTTNPISTTGDYAIQAYVQVVVVGTPSVGASFVVQWSPDGTTYYSSNAYTASTSAGTYYWIVDVPVTAESVEIVYSAQTGGASSTLTAQLGQVTAV